MSSRICQNYLVASLVVLLVATTCSRTSPPNIVLITVDTMRGDHVGYAGGREGLSPNIDALSRTGVTFTNAHSVSGWTLPSLATILSGRYPRSHGMITWEGDIKTNVMLAQMLSDNGYDTAGFVSHVMLRKGSGFGKGFDTYDESVLRVGNPHKVASAKPLTDLAIEHLRTMKAPFFLWVHYFDPHFDYLAHEKYRDFGDATLDRYDQEIAHTDEHIGRLLDELAALQLLDNTAVVFTADHGEEFGEHGGVYHYTLFEEVLRVPCVIRAPGLTPRVDDRLVSQVDFLPTILRLAGLENPDLIGRDMLSPAIEQGRLTFYERQRPPLWRQFGVRQGDFKLVFVEPVDTSTFRPDFRKTLPEVNEKVHNVIPGAYLYDLTKDPLEKNGVIVEDSELVQALAVALKKYMDGQFEAPDADAELDEDTIKKLRSLGYIR